MACDCLAVPLGLLSLDAPPLLGPCSAWSWTHINLCIYAEMLVGQDRQTVQVTDVKTKDGLRCRMWAVVDTFRWSTWRTSQWELKQQQTGKLLPLKVDPFIWNHMWKEETQISHRVDCSVSFHVLASIWLTNILSNEQVLYLKWSDCADVQADLRPYAVHILQ